MPCSTSLSIVVEVLIEFCLKATANVFHRDIVQEAVAASKDNGAAFNRNRESCRGWAASLCRVQLLLGSLIKIGTELCEGCQFPTLRQVEPEVIPATRCIA